MEKLLYKPYLKQKTSNNMTVLFITGYFPFQQGGAEYQALFLAQHLQKHADVSFIYRDHWNKKSVLHENGFTLYPISPIKIKQISKPYIFEYRQLNRILYKSRPSFIYVRGLSAYAGIAARYAKYNNCKLIWHIAHDKDLQPLKFRLSKNILFEIADKKAAEYGIKNADYIISQTAYQAKLLEATYKRKCNFVLGNWHPLPEDCRKMEDRIKILWIANWKAIKQPEIFIQLAKRLLPDPNLSFSMIGRTGKYSSLANQATQYGINVMGEISNNRVNQLLAKSHILVNTSKQEGFSNTFIQAWMNRVPVVSFQVDPDDVLKKEGLGYCSGNFEQLVQDTKKLLTDSHLRGEMGHRARCYAARHHSLKNTDKIIKLITPMMTRR